MKTISINLYEFKELGKDAQKVALSNQRNWVGEHQAEITNDSFGWTMEEMEKALGIWVRMENRATKWGWNEDRWEELSDDPKYLVRYINWVMGNVDNRKTYYLPFEKSRYYHPTMTPRKSNIVGSTYDCSLTGEWSDGTFGRWMDNAWDWVRDGLTIDQFVDGLVCEFRARWSEEIDWGYSDDNVRDIIDNECFLFLEDGRLYSI